MMVRIECIAARLAVLAVCSSRRVEAKGARRVASRTAIIEWLCGAEAPRAQSR